MDEQKGHKDFRTLRCIDKCHMTFHIFMYVEFIKIERLDRTISILYGLLF